MARLAEAFEIMSAANSTLTTRMPLSSSTVWSVRLVAFGGVVLMLGALDRGSFEWMKDAAAKRKMVSPEAQLHVVGNKTDLGAKRYRHGG